MSIDDSDQNMLSVKRTEAPSVEEEVRDSPDDLDYSNEIPKKLTIANPEPKGDYDPRPAEDGARRRIAYLLIALLWVLVIAIVFLLAFGVIKITDLKEFAVLLGPIVTLVSAATGFYYGTKAA